MWTSDNFKIEVRELELAISSNVEYYHSLYIDDLMLINIMELSFYNSHFGVLVTYVCEGCGIGGCENPRLVAIRRINKYIFFTPFLEENKYYGQDNEQDYSQEDIFTYFDFAKIFAKSQGSYYLAMDNYIKLRKLCRCLIKPKNIKKFTKEEFFALMIYESPQELFSQVADFTSLKENLILELETPNIQILVQILKAEYQRLTNATKFTLETLTQEDKLFTLNYLDSQNVTKSWQPLYQSNNGFGLVLAGKFKVILV